MTRATYTQHTIAWPDQSTRPGVVDELLIDIGGVGEFGVTFHQFSGGHTGCQIAFFGDGYVAFRDARFQRALRKWAQMGRKRDAATPAQWIGWLAREGFEPSEYHERGVAA
jgi:hypothetical protein